MFQAVGSLFTKSRDASTPSDSTYPQDMRSWQRGNDRAGRLPLISANPLRGQAPTSNNDFRPTHHSPRNEYKPKDPRNEIHNPHMEEGLQKTRRQLAMELRSANRDRDDMNTRVHKLLLKAKELRTESDKSREEIKVLQADIRTLATENKALRVKMRTIAADNGSLEKDFLELKDKNDFVASRYDYVVKYLLKPFASSKNRKYDDRTTDSINQMLGLLLEDALASYSQKALVEKLEGQTKSLQRQLLQNVKKIEPVSDADFSTEFRSLVSSIKSLTRPIRNVDTSAILRTDEIRQCVLLGRVGRERLIPSVRVRSIIESFVWSVLYTWVFSSPFYIYQLDDLAMNFLDVFGENHKHEWPTPTSLSEQWRLITTEQLLGCVGEQAVTHGRMMGASPQLEENIRSARSRVKDSIIGPLCRISPGTDFSRVDTIVNKAFTLSLRMSLQRCRMQVVYPEVGDIYLNGQVDLTSIAESDTVEEGKVALIASPGFAKWGDAQGEHLDQRLDLVPAMVLVEPLVKKEIAVKMEEL
ncbi:hypothetical protein N0V90_007229 [Kalmusia sp. IMI 367209]|nr:hypothetical protein N0V90_007229 [Kalmusia sp. IMI 367209]